VAVAASGGWRPSGSWWRNEAAVEVAVEAEATAPLWVVVGAAEVEGRVTGLECPWWWWWWWAAAVC
jgi:hypothetical protein